MIWGYFLPTCLLHEMCYCIFILRALPEWMQWSKSSDNYTLPKYVVHTFKAHLCNHFNKIAAFCPCCNSSSAIISSWIWPTLGNLRLETVSVGLPNSDVNPIQAVTVLVHAPHSAPALIQPSTRILLIIWWTTVLVASMGASLLWRITLWLLADQCAPPSSRRDNNGISQE